MKALPPGLQAHLDKGATTLAWCWRIVRSDSVTFGFTDHDRPLVFDATTFEPESGFAASELRSSSDLSVDAQDAEGVLRSDRITETDILDGRWDNAEVEVWRVNWSDTGQRVLLRRGAIGQIRRGRLAFVAEMRSLAHVLGQTLGRTFQATCDAQLGDGRCGVDLEHTAYRGIGTVVATIRDRAFVTAGLSGFTSGWFNLGTLIWTSGKKAGGVRQGSCRLHPFSRCAICGPGHGVAAASFMGERVGDPMASAPGFGSLGIEPDRADGVPVARPT